jgi:hypothetical protein
VSERKKAYEMTIKMIRKPKTDAVKRLEAAQEQARKHQRMVKEAIEAIRLSKPYKGNAPEWNWN